MKSPLVVLTILFASILLFSSNASAQTISSAPPTRDDQDRQRMIRLEQIAERHSEAYIRQKANAIHWAETAGMPIRQVSDSTGRVVELMRIDQGRPLYYSTHNAEGAALIKTDRLYPGGEAALSLTGFGQTLGIWDGGPILKGHDDLIDRVFHQDDALSHPVGMMHPTHVAGTMVGAGTNPLVRGMAYQANLHAWDWNNDLAEMATAAAAGLKVSQHSYGVVAGWQWADEFEAWRWHGDITLSETEDAFYGFYSEQARAWDEIAWNAPGYLIVTSSGNDRGLGPDPGESHFIFMDGDWKLSNMPRQKDGGWDGYDCIPHTGNAKNVITVGAVDHNRNMAAFSAWGPTDDGRIKPDIVAKGVRVYSTYYANPFQSISLSGTSMAGPMVSGSVGLLLEHHQNLHPGTDLPAATLKALILHSADDMIGGAPGPDYRFGWGLMDTQKAAQIMTDNATHGGIHIREMFLEQAAQITIPVIASGVEPLRASIVWADVPGTPRQLALNDRTPMLVNDLDMRIAGTGSREYLPYTLDPTNPAAPATTGDNYRDNIEMVHIQEPDQGQSYVIRITHKGTLTAGNQPFSLVITGILAEGLPLITTTDITSISQTTAAFGGHIIYDGGQAITARGLVWHTMSGPSLQTNSGFSVEGAGSGAFVSQFSGLAPTTTYYVRAYATNSSGTSYGNTLTFTTPDASSLFAGGSGSAGDPFLIATPQHLDNVRLHLSAHFRQITDIDLGTAPWNQGEGWEPINDFGGVYNGNNHAISQLMINRTVRNYVGLFSRTQKAHISNLKLQDVNVTGNNMVGALAGGIFAGAFYLPTVVSNVSVTGNITGNDAVGGLIGRIFDSEVHNCHSQASVQGNDYIGGLLGVIGDIPDDTGSGLFFVGGDVYDSSATCVVSGNSNIGGLVGRNESGSIWRCSSKGIISGEYTIGGLVGDVRYGRIEKSQADCIITGTGPMAGGLAGDGIEATIEQCTSSGSVESSSSNVGGLVGVGSRLTLKNCYSRTTVSGGDQVGGLLGSVSSVSNIVNCYSTGLVKGTTNNRTGGLIGYKGNVSVSGSFWDVETSGMTNSDGGIGKTTAEMTKASTFLLAGWDMKGSGTEGVWNINESHNDHYPFLAWQYPDVSTIPDVQEAHLPYIGDVDVSHITMDEALIGAQITTMGNPTPTAYGFCWNTGGNPTTKDQVLSMSGKASNAPFHIYLSGLEPATTYYIKAFATNQAGTFYSRETSFTTLAMLSERPPGSGTASDPYLISNLANLLWLSEEVNSGTDFFGDFFLQTANIDASSTKKWDRGRGWMPIGRDRSIIFAGSYDGNGYVIDKLFINRPDSDFVGLFGVAGGVNSFSMLPANIQNLGITNTDITGGVYTGGLAGWVIGFVTNCYVDGKVSGRESVGGLVGRTDSGSLNVTGGLNIRTAISESYSTAMVMGRSNPGSGMYVGGLVGTNGGSTINNCYAMGAVIGISFLGGLAGSNSWNGEIDRCFSVSTVTSNGGFGYSGLVGQNNEIVTNSFYDQELSGHLYSSGGTGKTTAEMKQLITFLTAGWDFKNTGPTHIWNMHSERNEGYPFLSWQFPEYPPSAEAHNEYQPVLATGEIEFYTSDQALLTGGILARGNPEISQFGFCWSNSTTPSIDDNAMFFENTGMAFHFEYLLTNLAPETTYFIRSFAINRLGTVYGNMVTCKTRPQKLFREGMTDADGNSYQSVVIGAQEWMAQNLRTTRFSDGDNIHLIGKDESIIEETPSAYAIWPHTSVPGINDPEEMLNYYGALYTWKAVKDDKCLCSNGWRVPSIGDWQELISNIPGGLAFGGKALKSTRQNVTPLPAAYQTDEHPYWWGGYDGKLDGKIYLIHGTDDFGFNALPSGSYSVSSYNGLSHYSLFWSTDENPSSINTAFAIEFTNQNDRITQAAKNTNRASSVRCMRDVFSVRTDTLFGLTWESAFARATTKKAAIEDIHKKGMVWDTLPLPNMMRYAGISSDLSHLTSFTCELTSLLPMTKYYVRAYAINGHDTVYGRQIEFTTEKPRFTLNYMADENGRLSGSSTQTVIWGNNGRAIRAIPKTGYHFVQWSDGRTDNPRIDSLVTANINVSAVFDINQYTLSYLAGDNGSISGANNQTVSHGANGSPVTAIPNENYHFVRWIDGRTDNPRTDTNVTGNLSVTAQFSFSTGVKEPEAGTWDIYPNPAQGTIYVGFTHGGTQPAEIIIYNLHGQILSRTRITETGKITAEIDTEGLNPGVYLVELISDQPHPAKRLVIGR